MSYYQYCQYCNIAILLILFLLLILQYQSLSVNICQRPLLYDCYNVKITTQQLSLYSFHQGVYKYHMSMLREGDWGSDQEMQVMLIMQLAAGSFNVIQLKLTSSPPIPPHPISIHVLHMSAISCLQHPTFSTLLQSLLHFAYSSKQIATQHFIGDKSFADSHQLNYIHSLHV